MEAKGMRLRYYLLIALAFFAIAFGISAYKLIQVSQRAEALETANDIYEKDLSSLQREKEQLSDSIAKVKADRFKEIELRDRKIANLVSSIDEILETLPQKEKAVDSMPEEEVDQLHRKYYPNKQTAKKDAVKKAERVEVLEVAIKQQTIVISEQAVQITDLKQQVRDTELQNDLAQEINRNLQTQLEAEKAKKPKKNTLRWILRCLGVGAAGYVIGNLAK